MTSHCTSLSSPPSSSMVVKHWPCLLTLQKGSRFLKPNAWGNFSASPAWSTRPMTGCGTISASMWVHMNPFWQLSRDGNLHGSGMSHALTASSKPCFRTPRRVGNAMDGRGNAGWTTSKGAHLCACQNCSQWSPAKPPKKKNGRQSQLSHPSCTPLNPISRGSKVNWTSCTRQLLCGELMSGKRSQQHPCKQFKDSLKEDMNWCDIKLAHLEPAAMEWSSWCSLSQTAAWKFEEERCQCLTAAHEQHYRAASFTTRTELQWSRCAQLSASRLELQSHLNKTTTLSSSSTTEGLPPHLTSPRHLQTLGGGGGSLGIWRKLVLAMVLLVFWLASSMTYFPGQPTGAHQLHFLGWLKQKC